MRDGKDGTVGATVTFSPSNFNIIVDRSGTIAKTTDNIIDVKMSSLEGNLELSKISVSSQDSLPSGITVKSVNLKKGQIVLHFAKGGDFGDPSNSFAQTIFDIETVTGEKSQFAIFFAKVGEGVSLGRIETVPTTYRLENVTYKKSDGEEVLQEVVYAQIGDVIVLSKSSGEYSAGTVFKYNGSTWTEIDDINSCMVAYDDIMSIADGTTAKVICKTLVSQKALIDNLVTKFVNVMEGGYVKSSNYNGTKDSNGVPVNVANGSGASQGFALDTLGNAELMSKVHIGGNLTVDGTSTLKNTKLDNCTANNGTFNNISVKNAVIDGDCSVQGEITQGTSFMTLCDLSFYYRDGAIRIRHCSIPSGYYSLVRIEEGRYEFTINRDYLINLSPCKKLFQKLSNYGTLYKTHAYLQAVNIFTGDNGTYQSNGNIYANHEYGLSVHTVSDFLSDNKNHCFLYSDGVYNDSFYNIGTAYANPRTILCFTDRNTDNFTDPRYGTSLILNVYATYD